MRKAAIVMTIAILFGGFFAEAETIEKPTRIEIDTQIDLPFSASEVWAVLANLDRYPDWNPYHVRVEGALAERARLRLEIHKPNGHQLVLHPRVIQIVPERSLVWGGGVPGLFRGVHRFDLVPISDQCTRLYQTEVFAGLFVNFAALDAIEPGYAAMNKALLTYLTSRASGRSGRC